jgi:RNA polymerase sigma-70 factor, ECF subfamily
MVSVPSGPPQISADTRPDAKAQCTARRCNAAPLEQEEETYRMGAYEQAIRLDSFTGQAIESRLAERARPITELDDIDTLVRTYRARLLRFVTYSTGDPDLAESITQDTLLRAYQNRDKFRGESSVNTWLTSIALNVTRDYRRRQRYKFWKKVESSAVDVQEMASVLPSEGLNPEGQQLAKERVKQLYEIIETLSYNQRTVFLMKFTEEMQVSEISEVLGMPANTVRTHLHRALTTVRKKLGGSL